MNISLNWDSIKKNASINAIGTMGFGNFIGSVISSIFWIVIAGFLGTENYGQISYLLAIIGIFSVVSMFGGQYTMQVYTSKQIKLESSLYLISIVSGTSLAIILFILFQDIGVSISLIGITVLNFYFSEMIGKKLFSKYSLLFITQKILFVSLSLLLYFIIGFEGILIGYGLSHFIFIKQLTVFQNFNKNILVIIGPEGGFEEEEREFVEANSKNFFNIKLGSQILKADTAVIAALSLTFHFFS